MLQPLKSHRLYSDFYQHPNYRHLYFSKQGDCFDDDQKKFLGKHYPTGSYVSMVLPKIGSKTLHRLLCEVFLDPLPDLELSRQVCNHINGNKHDFRLENLEWTTYSGNSKHAYETGLREDNTPLLVKDVRTNSVTEYFSLQAAARAFGINGGNIHWYMSNRDKRPLFKKYFVIIRKGEKWPDTSKEAIGEIYKHVPSEYLLLEPKTKQSFIFESLYDAAEQLGLKEATVRKRLRQCVSKGLFGYRCADYELYYLSKFDQELPKDVVRKAKAEKANMRAPRKPVPITVTDLATGEITEWISGEAFAKSHGVMKNTFQKNVYCNNGVWLGKYKIEYQKNKSS